jgi:hypothetical protein
MSGRLLRPRLHLIELHTKTPTHDPHRLLHRQSMIGIP